MTRIRVVGEDLLCCALGERLVAAGLPRWDLAGESINTHGVTKLVTALPRYMQLAANVQAVLCIADSDHACVKTLREQWLPSAPPRRFLLRIAVSEAESWVLADREATAAFFGVAAKHVPDRPEEVPDAKRTVLQLARLSKNRQLREEMVSALDIHKAGSGYNLHLCRLVSTVWQPQRAAGRSDSLRRALTRVADLGA